MDSLKSLIEGEVDDAVKPNDIDNVSRKLHEETLEVEEHLFTEGKKVLKKITVECNRTDTISKDMQSLESRISDITIKLDTDVLPRLYDGMENVSLVIKDHEEKRALRVTLEQLRDISHNLTLLQEQRKNRSFLNAANTILTMGNLIQECKVEADILTTLKRELTIQKEGVLDDLKHEWEKSVTWSEGVGSESERKVSLSLATESDGEVTCVSDLIHSLDILNNLNRRGQELCTKLYSNLILNLFPTNYRSCDKSASVSVDKCGLCSVFTIRVCSGGGANSASALTSQEMISRLLLQFGHLSSLLDFLNRHLFSLSSSLVRIFHQSVGGDVVERVFLHSLQRAVPDCTRLLPHYQQLVQRAYLHFSSMRDLLLIPGDKEGEVRQVAADVAGVFIERKCQSLLVQAQRLASKPLHHSQKIEMPSQPDTKLADGNDDNLHLHQFLVDCEVSSSVLEFTSALEAALADCFTCVCSGGDGESEGVAVGDDVYVFKLLAGVRNMLELFVSTSPIHHQTKIQELPLIAALFHNNLMYLSHELLYISVRCECKLRQLIPRDSVRSGRVCDYVSVIHYTDLVPEIRELAVHTLLLHRQQQKQHITNIIRDLNGISTTGGSNVQDNKSKVEKSLKQCCHQLTQLFSIWEPVLPNNVSRRVLGYLFTVLISELVSLVLSKSDISLDEASLYTSVCLTIQNTASSIFKEEVYQYILSYERLIELHHLLTGSLHDILDRWTEGKGPLAAAYTPAEVREIIRALFQNTERRANAISKIR